VETALVAEHEQLGALAEAVLAGVHRLMPPEAGYLTARAQLAAAVRRRLDRSSPVDACGRPARRPVAR
jgi:hypothetical protein